MRKTPLKSSGIESQALLAEILAAFPPTPYPGDRMLSDCWCEECAWSVRNLRGKSWKQAQLEDFNLGDGGRVSTDAFGYYLPAMLTLAIRHPDETHLACEINSRFVTFIESRDNEIETIQQTVSRLSKPQRTTLVHFFSMVEESRLAISFVNRCGD